MDEFILDENLTPNEAFIITINKIREDPANEHTYFDIYNDWDIAWRKRHPFCLYNPGALFWEG